MSAIHPNDSVAVVSIEGESHLQKTSANPSIVTRGVSGPQLRTRWRAVAPGSIGQRRNGAERIGRGGV